MSHCSQAGYLVSAVLPVMAPGDPPLTEAEVAAGRFRGCNHLECSFCHRQVRQRPAANFPTPWPPDVQLADLYDAGNLDAIFVPEPEFPQIRAYACRCRRETMIGAASCEERWLEYGDSWGCAGHPPPASAAP